MRLWIAAAVFLGLIVLGLAMAPRVIDWDAYRSDIEAAASRLSGHEVTLGGPIRITLLPRPMMTARNATMRGESAAAVGFELTAGEAEVALEAGPLLVGRAVVRHLGLRRPVLTVDAEDSGRLSSWPPQWRDWAAPFLKLGLEGIDIVDGQIQLARDLERRDTALSDLSLQLHLKGPGGPLEAAGLFKTARHQFTLSSTFGRPGADGTSTSRITIEARNGIDETTTLRFNGTLKPLENDPNLRGRMTLTGPDLQHGLAALAAATGYPSTFQSIAAAQPFTLEGRIETDRQGIGAKDVQITLAERTGKADIALALHPRTRLDVDLDLPALHIADHASLNDFLPLDLLSKLRVPPGEIDLNLRELVYRDRATRQARVRLVTSQDGMTVVEQAKAQLPGLIDISFQGRLRAGDIGPRLQGRLAAVGDDLRSSLEWLDLIEGAESRGGWRRFSLESEVDISSVEIALSSIDMRLDSSRLEGQASLRFSDRRRLALDLNVDRLNADLYLSGIDRASSLKRLSDGLRDLDAGIDLRFNRLTWDGVSVQEASIVADVETGKLTLDQAMARTVGDTVITVDGDVDVDAETVDLTGSLMSQHPIWALRQFDLDLPRSSSRLLPITLEGEAKGALERAAFQLQADYDGGEAVLQGEAGWVDGTAWYDLTVGANHPDHQSLAGQFGLAPLLPAHDAPGVLALAGRLRHGAESPWTLSGNAKLGPTSFTGSLAYRPEAAAGPWEAKLSVGAPKTDSLAPLLILAGLRLANDWTPDRWLGRLPGMGLRTAWLDRFEGSLSLASKGGLAGDGIEIDARLTDGLLYVDRLEARPWNGRLQAEFSLERRRDQPFAALALDLHQVEAGEMAAWFGMKRAIQGPLDLKVEASSSGRTPYQMMSGLFGDVTLAVGPGEINGFDVPTLRRMLQPDADGQPGTDRSFGLPFSRLEAEAGISRGILTLESGRLVVGDDAQAAREAAVAGTADLLLWMLDLTLSTEDAAPSAETPTPVYRVVGPPNRPDGFAISPGN